MSGLGVPNKAFFALQDNMLQQLANMLIRENSATDALTRVNYAVGNAHVVSRIQRGNKVNGFLMVPLQLRYCISKIIMSPLRRHIFVCFMDKRGGGFGPSSVKMGRTHVVFG